MKTKSILLGSAIVLALGMVSCNSNSTSEDSKDSTEQVNNEAIDATAPTDSIASAQKEDAETVVELASGGMMEVELAKVAVQKATSPKVKKFAQMMIDDHSKANNDLKTLAESKNIVLPGTISDDHQKTINDVSEETGKQFDRKYMDVMLDDHKKDIDKFQRLADKGNDADIKAFAAKTLPTLIHHREEAEKLEKMTDKL
jgi:putative membrane protein